MSKIPSTDIKPAIKPADFKSEAVTDSILESSVSEAETQAQNSMVRFETAMDHLAEKIELTAHQVQHVKEVVQIPTKALKELKNQTLISLLPLLPLVGQVRGFIQSASKEVRRDPKFYATAAAGLAIGVFLIGALAAKNEAFED
jgi:hypothetical protein